MNKNNPNEGKEVHSISEATHDPPHQRRWLFETELLVFVEFRSFLPNPLIAVSLANLGAAHWNRSDSGGGGVDEF